MSGKYPYSRTLSEASFSKGFAPVAQNVMSYLHNFEEDFNIKNERRLPYTYVLQADQEKNTFPDS